MQKLTSISNKFAGRAAIAAGSLFAAEGVVQIVHSSQNSNGHLVGLAPHLNLGFALAGMILMAPTFIALGRYAGTRLASKASIVAAAGTVVLGLTCITSLVHGRDYGMFSVIAPLTNGAWLLGSLAIAVPLKRNRRVPAWVAIGLPVVWVTVIPMSGFGGALIAGAYLLTVGYLLTNDAVEQPAQPAAQVAAA